MSAPLLDAKIGQIAVTVHDIERAVSFYRDTLGLTYLFEAPSMAFFACGDIRLMLTLPEGQSVPGDQTVIYFQVEDLTRAFQQLTARDVKTVGQPHRIAKMPDHELWMAFFRDMEGNLFGLMSEVRDL